MSEAEAEAAAAAAAADPNAAAAAAAGGGTAAEPKWHEDARWGEHRAWLTTKGALVDDPLEALDKAVRAGAGAEKFLGRGADALMTKPGQGQSLSDWMRANAAVFGLPDAPEKYDIAKPELAAGVEWDETLEAEARKIAHENGVSPAALQSMVGLYAKHLGDKVTGINAQLTAAKTEMMAQLERDWGAQAPGKIAQARLAAQSLMTQAGLNQDGQREVLSVLAEKTGDAGVMRLFATLAGMMGEDTLTGGGGGGGGGAPTTPAEARARLDAMNAPDGAYGKAFAAGDRLAMAKLEPERQALLRIAAGS